MYDTHVPRIAKAMRASPEVFARAIMFAVLSARTQFPRIVKQMQELDNNGARARVLWGWKADSFDYVEQHKAELWENTYAAGSLRQALWELTRVPGLGIVKAGFVLQLAGFAIGCLDVRNIKRLGLQPRAYRSDGAKRKAGKAWGKAIDRYVHETHGKARELWDAWCSDAANEYLSSPDAISAMHLVIIPKGA